jgi:hypothetical protein
MSDVVISLMLTAGVAGWIFNKIGIRTGGSTPKAIATSVIAGILAFMTMMTVLSFVPG